MQYVKNIKLQCKEYKHPLQMYPDIGLQDIQQARYRNVCGEETNPDICALPPLLSGRDLMLDNMRAFPGYDAKKALSLQQSERLAALAAFKDEVTVYMPFHMDLERRLQECLMSAYRRREYGILNEEAPDILSVAKPIATSVQDASLIGTAGTGKSTAVRLMLDRYPKAIQHNLSGHRYTQVPILETTAREGDMKSIFIDLSMSLDIILGTAYYEPQMRKMGTVTKMEAYLVKLIQLFHVAVIVIDEIQSVIKRKISMFDHLLSVTASSGVSVMIIGTEAAVEDLNKNVWFSRRFSQLGRISSDMKADDSAVLERIVQIIWDYQWTNKRYPLTKKILSTLVEESYRNVDFLTTIFITAQLMCINSEGKEDLELNSDTIKKAAGNYPKAKELLRDGIDAAEALYQQEKRSTIETIMKEAAAERQKEQSALMQSSVTAFSSKVQVTAELVDLLGQSGFDDTKQIEHIIRRETANNEQFLLLERSQQAKIVIAELLKKEYSSGKKRKPRAQNEQDAKPAHQDRDNADWEGSGHGIDMLQAAIS